jgi:ribosome biogenesis protein NSA1
MPLQQHAFLPTRLRAWHQPSDEETFAYGGDEVDLSVWNTEKAFSSIQDDSTANAPKKRKRGSELLPGEVWRARNVAARLNCVYLYR